MEIEDKDSRNYVEGEFIVKLNHTSNGHGRATVRICSGRDGIVAVINGWMKSDNVYGYYLDAIIQPLFRDSNEAKVICINGYPVSANKTKRGMRKSPVGSIVGKRENRDALYDFCRRAIMQLKTECPELIDGSLLRVDVFQNSITRTYVVNEIEGVNAQNTGTYCADGEMQANHAVAEYYYEMLCLLVETHLQLHPPSAEA